MSDISWIEVADSAIKIGLGALIGGTVSLIAVRMNHGNDRDKDLRSHRLATIERITDLMDNFFNAHKRTISRVAWIVECNNGQRVAITEEMELSARDADAQLLEATDGLRIAVTRLQLLGETNCAKALGDAAELVLQFRNEYVASRHFPGSETIDVHLRKVKAHRDKVNEGLHVLYGSS